MASNLPSLSTIVIAAWWESLKLNPVGNEAARMVTLNISLSSNILSSTIGTSNGTMVSPAGNVTV